MDFSVMLDRLLNQAILVAASDQVPTLVLSSVEVFECDLARDWRATNDEPLVVALLQQLLEHCFAVLDLLVNMLLRILPKLKVFSRLQLSPFFYRHEFAAHAAFLLAELFAVDRADECVQEDLILLGLRRPLHLVQALRPRLVLAVEPV